MGAGGIKDAMVVEHGSTGTVSYNTVNFGILNRLKPRGKLFSSGLDEDDVVMGWEDKLIAAIKEVDRLYHPRLLAIVATGVTSVIGLDLDGIADEYRGEIQAKLITFPGGGFRGSYRYGIEEVFSSLANNVVRVPDTRNNALVNILGVTVDTFNHVSDLHEIERLLGLLGLRINTVFTQHTNVESIEKLGEAGLNLVLYDTGIEVARFLEQSFGIPWVYGMPFGIKGTIQWLETVAEKIDAQIDRAAIADDLKKYGQTMSVFTSFMKPFDRLRIGVSGTNEYVKGLTYFLKQECGIDVKLAVIRDVKPDVNNVQELQSAGVDDILVDPEVDMLKSSIQKHRLHVFWGNTYELKTAVNVPIKIHAAFPSFDYVNFHDGTPFLGFKGNGYLIQTLVNGVNQHPEVWRI